MHIEFWNKNVIKIYEIVTQWNWNTAGSEYCKLPTNIRTRNNIRHYLYMWTYDHVLSKESDMKNVIFWLRLYISFESKSTVASPPFNLMTEADRARVVF
jgi:hypothetical protein